MRPETRRILKVIAYVLSAIGIAVCLFSLVAISALGKDSLWVLSHRFLPTTIDTDRYRGLYDLAHDVIVSRTAEVRFAQCALGCSLMMNGLLIWSLARWR
jgi:hypothetical protein